MKPSPLAIAKKRFGITTEDSTEARKEAKAKLVAAVEALTEGGLWIDRVNEDKGLAHVSNKKLLHLLDTLESVKTKFGTRDDLIKAIVDAEKREKDATYAGHFADWPTPRLWDRYQAAIKA